MAASADTPFDVALFFDSARGAGRTSGTDGSIDWVCDSFGDATCLFLRRRAASASCWRLGGLDGLVRARSGGWLATGAGGAGFWFPALPAWRVVDAQGRMRRESTAVLDLVGLQSGVLSIDVAPGSDDAVLDLVVWRLGPAEAGEVLAPAPLARQAAYLWGSHTTLTCWADVYLHVVHGRVYENRWAWPFKLRICSENDAHAITVQLGGLARATGQRLPVLLRRQVLQSVLDRQDADGGFRHGVWTDSRESHYRLHCSAMHLFMDVLAEGPDPEVADALRRAADFMAARHETLPVGAWFLHDELEASTEAMTRGPFRWVRSRALGKSEANMLVLNTQLDAGVALHRYTELTGDRRHQALVQSSLQATRAVLQLRPAEPLYRLLAWLVGLTFMPTPRAAALPAWKRALKRLTWKYLIPRLPAIKARLPRLVFPGGYIDRELALQTFAHDYLAINLMDLARYLRRIDDPVVSRVLVRGLSFAHGSGVLERWRELDYQKYALGFWAEALYHACTLFPEAKYRQWLAEAMLVLEDLKMGLPPSLLGANAEAVPVAEQLPCPNATDDRLRVANLGQSGRGEWLVVNAFAASIPLAWNAAPAESVVWHTSDGTLLPRESLWVPPRGWIWGRAPAA